MVAHKNLILCGVTVRVPVGSMDRPCEYGENAWKVISDRKNWKLPTSAFVTDDRDKADAVAYALDWYVGGHEMTASPQTDGTVRYTVTSKGYYHYVGA